MSQQTNNLVVFPSFDIEGDTSATGFDEVSAGGALRPHWDFLSELINLPADLVPGLDATVRRLLTESAVTYRSDGTRRPWRLDPLPYVMDPAEWTMLESGLKQRAELLNAIVGDVYGPQRLLHDGQLPLPLLFANPNYLLPSCGYQASAFLQLLAFDLARSEDGQWRVLSNRCEAPSGLGYSLENRMILARTVPELFARGNIARLAQFFRKHSEHLQRIGRDTGATDGLSVILTAGPDQSTYFEHTYIGRYLGFPVVEGADLTVRDGDVFLKTLEGLKRVNMIWRQIESADCDPLELKPRSRWGAPGLLASAVRGNVIMANAIGSGVVENDAIMSFLPGLCQSLLGEELKLPSLATWWCGQRDEQAYVGAHLEQLVLRQAYVRKPLLESSMRAYMATDVAAGAEFARGENLASGAHSASGPTNDRLRQTISTAPYNYVGREPIQLSRIPYWDDAGGWRSAPMTLRVYVAATDDGYQVMPGGLARVATPDGDISKDVWVPAAPGDTVAFLPSTPVAARRSDRDLPSHTADDLFWLGRYLERTEGAVRLYRSLFRYIAGEGTALEEPVALDILTRLLASMDYLSSHRARRAAEQGRGTVEQELWNTLFDPESDDGLAKVLANVHRTAEHVRERLSADAWRLFEGLSVVPTLRWRVHTVADVEGLLDDLIQKISALNGQIHENMTRGYGWRLLDIGRRIERCRYVIRVMRDLCTGEPQELGSLALLLDVCDSTITHRARYQSYPTLTTVLDLLLIDGTNPRSVIFQVEALQRHTATMPMEQQDNALSESARLLLAAHTELALADVDKLVKVISKKGVRTHLDRLLKRTEQSMSGLHQEITRTYFEHTHTRRR